MAWEKKGKRAYYYQAKRIGSQVRKFYLGSGVEAYQAAEAAKLKREIGLQTQQALRELQELGALALAVADELEIGISQLVQASLLAAGYHQHRSNWRKRRG